MNFLCVSLPTITFLEVAGKVIDLLLIFVAANRSSITISRLDRRAILGYSVVLISLFNYYFL